MAVPKAPRKKNLQSDISSDQPFLKVGVFNLKTRTRFKGKPVWAQCPSTAENDEVIYIFRDSDDSAFEQVKQSDVEDSYVRGASTVTSMLDVINQLIVPRRSFRGSDEDESQIFTECIRDLLSKGTSTTSVNIGAVLDDAQEALRKKKAAGVERRRKSYATMEMIAREYEKRHREEEEQSARLPAGEKDSAENELDNRNAIDEMHPTKRSRLVGPPHVLPPPSTRKGKELAPTPPSPIVPQASASPSCPPTIADTSDTRRREVTELHARIHQIFKTVEKQIDEAGAPRVRQAMQRISARIQQVAYEEVELLKADPGGETSGYQE